MFGTKSRWPGVSRMVKQVLSVSNLLVAMSIVTPRALSSDPWSITQAKTKEPLPILSASFLYLSRVRWSTAPRSKSKRPINVLFPESTWPENISVSEEMEDRTGVPITTKFAALFRLIFLYSANTSRFLLLVLTGSSTERLWRPLLRSTFVFAGLPCLVVGLAIVVDAGWQRQSARSTLLIFNSNLWDFAPF